MLNEARVISELELVNYYGGCGKVGQVWYRIVAETSLPDEENQDWKLIGCDDRMDLESIMIDRVWRMDRAMKKERRLRQGKTLYRSESMRPRYRVCR